MDIRVNQQGISALSLYCADTKNNEIIIDTRSKKWYVPVKINENLNNIQIIFLKRGPKTVEIGVKNNH